MSEEKKPPEVLDKIADVVLKYRPKGKQPKKPKTRRRKSQTGDTEA